MVKKEETAAYIVIGVFILFGIALLYDGGGYSEKSHRNKMIQIADRINEQKPIAAEAKAAIPRYTIVKTKDVSVNNCKRYSIRVRVDHVLSSNELKTISNKIITDFKATSPFNALTLWFYLPDSDINGAYTAGMTEYAPYGDWSQADVQTGEYTHHRLKLSPGNATGIDPEKSRVPGLSIETKKRIFFEIVAAQDRGVGDDEAYGIIARKFSVAETTVRKTVIEGVANGWPIPML